jgi:hypothetical protein
MDHSNRNLTAELDPIEARLRAERATPSPLELDRIKQQAIRQAERSRPSLYANTKGSFMKSRLALTLILVAGFMFSATGTTLAISGSSGDGSAASSQYVAPGGEETGKPDHGVKGAHAEGGEETNKTLQRTGTETAVAVTPAPAAEQVAVVSSDNSLPFTGFLAIPLLAIGVGLVALGGFIAVRNRREPAARV